MKTGNNTRKRPSPTELSKEVRFSLDRKSPRLGNTSPKSVSENELNHNEGISLNTTGRLQRLKIHQMIKDVYERLNHFPEEVLKELAIEKFQIHSLPKSEQKKIQDIYGDDLLTEGVFYFTRKKHSSHDETEKYRNQINKLLKEHFTHKDEIMGNFYPYISPMEYMVTLGQDIQFELPDHTDTPKKPKSLGGMKRSRTMGNLGSK